MGGFCSQSYTELPSYSETVGGTTLQLGYRQVVRLYLKMRQQSLDLHTHSILAQE